MEEYDISPDQLWKLLRKDAIFRDYFNKFCCLSVFGQKVAFLAKTRKFIFDPPPLPSSQQRASNQFFLKWLKEERLSLFIRSPAGSACRLCQKLRDAQFSFSAPETNHSGVEKLCSLKRRQLNKVTHMVKFRRMVENSKHDFSLVEFWLDVDRLRFCASDRQTLTTLRAIQKKYFMKASRRCLHYRLLDNVYPDWSPNDYKAFDYERTMSLKLLVFDRLHNYWLPRFLAESRDIDHREKAQLRKIAALVQCGSQEMIHQAVCKSPLVRLVSPPCLQELEKKREELSDDEDESHLLIHEVEEKEIWRSEIHRKDRLDSDLSRRSSETLGSETEEHVSDRLFVRTPSRKRSSMHGRSISIRKSRSLVNGAADDTADTLRRRWNSNVTEPSRHHLLSVGGAAYEVEVGQSSSSSSSSSSDNTCRSSSEISESTSGTRVEGVSKHSSLIGRSDAEAGEPSASSSVCSLPPLHSDESKSSSVSLSDICDCFESCSRGSLFQVASGEGAEAEADSGETIVGEFLRRVRRDLMMPDILASDELAGCPFRAFLVDPAADQHEDRNCFGDFCGNLGSALPQLLDVWREIENLRITYFRLTSTELSTKCDALTKSIAWKVASESHHMVSSMNLNPDAPFPEQLRTLQRNIEEALERKWCQFAMLERKGFETRVRHPRRVFMVALDQVGEDLLRYRSDRAYRLFLQWNDCDVSASDDSSDEEGNAPTARPKVRVRLPELNSKTIAEYSAHEYPRVGLNYKVSRVRRIIRRRLVIKPMYLRPIKRRGVYLTRPPKRPKNIIEVVRDPLHFEFFKRYMKMQKSEAPLFFWKAVELLKREDSTRSRKKKAQQILFKFFSAPAGGGSLLQCDHDIIKKIALSDTVTTSMLSQAAHEVFNSLEKNWASRYFNTFDDTAEEEEEEERPPVKMGLHFIKTKLARCWDPFTDFMRRAARFLACMRDPKEFALFYQYLAEVSGKTGNLVAAGDSSEMDLDLLKFQTVVYKNWNIDTAYKYKYKAVLGKRITLDFLPNDLLLWLEADRYVKMSDNLNFMLLTGCYEDNDRVEVRNKSHIIIRCLIDSFIPPKTRVNVDRDTVAELIKTAAGLEPERGLFHQAVINIFPVLLHFWKLYRQERFAYVSRRVVREQHRQQVLERYFQQRKASDELREKRRMTFQLERKSSIKNQQSSIDNKIKASQRFPDYVKDLDKKEDPYERVKGLLYTDPPTLHFTLEKGLKLILPPRRNMVQTLVDDEEDENELFMKVWTRGAQVIQVIRHGSQPRLFNLDEKKKNQRVTYDVAYD